MNNGSPQERLASWWRELDPEKHAALGILGVCGILSLGLSFAYLRFHVRSPFFVSRSLLSAPGVLTASEPSQADSMDTDRDGLSDAAEMSVHRTSPYLPDTDSDGVTDGQEVALQSDPNCPRGQTCQDAASAIVGSTTSTEGSGSTLDSFLSPVPPAAASTSAPIIPPAPETLTAIQMRAYFQQTGLVDPDILQKLSDEAVVQVYRAAYDEAERIQAAGQP